MPFGFIDPTVYTIDGNADPSLDNGALVCDRKNYSFHGYMSHNNTSEAVANFLTMFQQHQQFYGEPNPPVFGVIVGHGNDGFLNTGSGDQVGSDDKVLAYWNIPTLERALAPLANTVLAVTLLGCNVGVGDVGSDLILAIARIMNTAVYAPMSDVLCTTFGDGMTNITCGPQWKRVLKGSNQATVFTQNLNNELLEAGQSFEVLEVQGSEAWFHDMISLRPSISSVTVVRYVPGATGVSLQEAEDIERLGETLAVPLIRMRRGLHAAVVGRMRIEFGASDPNPIVFDLLGWDTIGVDRDHIARIPHLNKILWSPK
jgi:hypothetical protein